MSATAILSARQTCAIPGAGSRRSLRASRDLCRARSRRSDQPARVPHDVVGVCTEQQCRAPGDDSTREQIHHEVTVDDEEEVDDLRIVWNAACGIADRVRPPCHTHLPAVRTVGCGRFDLDSLFPRKYEVSSASLAAWPRTIRIALADVAFKPSSRITPRQLTDALTASVNCTSDHERCVLIPEQWRPVPTFERSFVENRRDGEIRTPDPLTPSQVP
jgi:hypothetical protein